MNKFLNKSETTNIVNVKVSHIRPIYQNLKDWMSDTKNVYIGRKGIVFIDKKRFPEKDSIWANPFKIGKHGDRSEVLKKYENYILQKIISDNLENDLLSLQGKNLGCWCFPEKCHGEILRDLISKKLSEKTIP